MKKIIITKYEDGMELHKYLKKLFANMPSSTLYKLLRKKYFEINDKKTNGQEKLRKGDILTIFLSSETYNKFVGKDEEPIDKITYDNFDKKEVKSRILYEDKNIILYNKEVGLLSQGDKSGKESVNTILNEYLGTDKDNSVFIPSVVNRLDRNTAGIIIFAKTYIAAKAISKMIKDGKLEKHYLAIVNGNNIKKSDTLINQLKKDENTNKVVVKDYNGKLLKGYSLVKLRYNLIEQQDDISVIDVELLTGKTHQIRAQFAHIGHPLVGDKKYMSKDLYERNALKYKAEHQQLMCYKIRFGDFDEEELKNISKLEVKIAEQALV